MAPLIRDNKRQYISLSKHLLFPNKKFCNKTIHRFQQSVLIDCYSDAPIYLSLRLVMQVSAQNLPVKQLYSEVRSHTNFGIQGYMVAKKYEDPAAAIRNRDNANIKKKIKELKRGSYLEDEASMKKNIPGVCTYNLLPGALPKTKSNKNMLEKRTFLDEIITQSKKDHIPGPDQYNVLPALGSQLAYGNFSESKYEKKSIDDRKKNIHKITYLDNAEYEASQTPGVGEYLIERAQRSRTEHTASMSKLDRKPQFWKDYHKKNEENMEDKIRKKSPGAGYYHPQIVAYDLFENKKKMNRTNSEVKLAKLKSTKFRTQENQETSKNFEIGPGKYKVENQWVPKQKQKKGIFSIISKAPTPSIYY